MKRRDSLPPIVFQVTGILLGLYLVALWQTTGLFKPEFLGLSITLFSYGLARDRKGGDDS